MTDETIFATALEKADPADRAAFLAEACGADAELRRRVEGLLAAHEKAGAFLNRPAVGSVPESGGDGPTHAFRPPRGPGHAPTQGHGESDEDHDLGDALGFLAPPGRDGSLGRIGHYEVLEVLGRGGFGIVFRAFDEVLQRVVAVKVLAPSMAATSPARKRFLREARSSAAVRHDNVVLVHAVEEQPLPYLVMEFIPGETLQHRLDRSGPLDVPEVLRIGRQVAEGLAAAHATGLIHRDIKPSNVLIDSGPQPRVKITDFGLARAADDASLTRSGVVAGTPMYMAPEQAKGESLDHRADLFSLGSVMYVMCTGRPPFRAETTLAVLKRVADDEPRPMREVIPEVPEWLCRVVGKLHAKDPSERFQTAREVADVLADCEAQVKATGSLRDFSRIPGGKPTRFPRRRVAVVAGVLALLVCAAVWLGTPARRYVGNTGEVVVPPESGLTSVIVHRDGEAVTDWFGVSNTRTIALPPGKYKLEPMFAPGRTAAHWEVTTHGPFSSHTLSQFKRAPEFEVARGERVTVRAVMRDDPATAPSPPTPAEEGFVSLFNGKDLTGWTAHPPDAPWRVTPEGDLTGTGTGHLFSRRDYADFHLRADVRISDGGDSGLLFRCDRKYLSDRYPVGFEAMINPTGQQNPRTGSLTDPQSNYAYGKDPAVPPDTWFTYEVIAVGNQITLKVNGTTTLEGKRGIAKWPSGPVGLQLPGGGKTVSFRKIEIKELPAADRPMRSIVMNNWGVWVDPSKLCKVETTVGQATFTVPGTRPLNLNPEPGFNLDAPRWLWDADGDFTYQVAVQGFPWPKPGTSSRGVGGVSYRGAGFVVRVDEKNFVRFERAGWGEQHDGKPYWHAEAFVNGKTVADERDWVDGPTYHLQVERRGGSLVLRRSTDGSRWEDWKTIDTLPMPPRVRVGLVAVNSTTETFYPVFENLAHGVYPKPPAATPPSAEVKALREAVTAKEQSRDAAQTRLDAGKVSRLELLAAQADLTEARIRLARAERDPAAVVAELHRLVIVREEERQLTALRVEAGVERADALNQADARVADAKARLAKAQADAPPTKP